MSRPTQRRKNLRAQEGQEQLRPVNLQPNRKYLIATGYGDGVRTARAFENALFAGVKTADTALRAANLEGRQRAASEVATGQQARDEDDTNAGYNRAWDELDATYDTNLAAQELPELLREADWENLERSEVQNLISDYYQQQFGGIERDPDSSYTRHAAPRLLEIEARYLAEHDQLQLERVREEQRTKIFSNARAELIDARQADPDAQLNYQSLFEQTGVFFDGAEKKETFWNSVYNLAINEGDPSIIEDMPPMINGIPTGIDDPNLQDQHRRASEAASNRAAALSEQRAEAAKIERSQMVFNLQLAIAEKQEAGLPFQEELALLQSTVGLEGGASWSSYSAAVNFGSSTRADRESRSANLNAVATLTEQVMSGRAGVSEVFAAYSSGIFGYGEQAYNKMKSLMSSANSMASNRHVVRDPEFGIWKGEIESRYNPATEGAFQPLNQSILNIRQSAQQKYLELIFDHGKSPREAYMMVTEEMDVQVDTLSSNAQSQTSFTAENILTNEALINIASNPQGAREALAGIPPAAIESRILEAVDTGILTEAEATDILRQF